MFITKHPTTGPDIHHETFRASEDLVPTLPGLKTSTQRKTGRIKGRGGELRRRFIAITGTTLFAASLMNFSSFSGATANAAQVSCTADAGFTNCVRFTYSGADQTFTVPAGAINLNVRAWGAGGGSGSGGGFGGGGGGGGGGFAAGNLAVAPGSNLTIIVGQKGGQGNGGGMSAVLDGPTPTPGNIISAQLVASAASSAAVQVGAPAASAAPAAAGWEQV